jgi:hypothetical protein
MKTLSLVASILLFAAPGWATTIRYTLVGVNDNQIVDFDVTLPQTFLPCTTAGGGCFGVTPDFLGLTYSDSLPDPVVNFYQSGGLTIYFTSSSGVKLLVNNGGPVLFSGDVSNPTLQLYPDSVLLQQQSVGAPILDEAFTLYATVESSPGPMGPAPEPATWGLGGLALALFTLVRSGKTRRSIRT